MGGRKRRKEPINYLIFESVRRLPNSELLFAYCSRKQTAEIRGGRSSLLFGNVDRSVGTYRDFITFVKVEKGNYERRTSSVTASCVNLFFVFFFVCLFIYLFNDRSSFIYANDLLIYGIVVHILIDT